MSLRVLGRGPSNWLLETLMTLRSGGKSGMVPTKWLPSIRNSNSLGDLAREVGIFPVKLLLAMYTFLRESMSTKASSGMSPEKRLLDRYKDLRAPSFLKSGMGPSKLLSMILRLLKRGKVTSESTSILPDRPIFSSCRPHTFPSWHITPAQLLLFPPGEHGFVDGFQLDREGSALDRELLNFKRASEEGPAPNEITAPGDKMDKKTSTSATIVVFLGVFIGKNVVVLVVVDVGRTVGAACAPITIVSTTSHHDDDDEWQKQQEEEACAYPTLSLGLPLMA